MLHSAVSNIYFFYNNYLYKQKEGLAIGNPLAPALANVFLCHIEDLIFSTCPDLVPAYRIGIEWSLGSEANWPTRLNNSSLIMQYKGVYDWNSVDIFIFGHFCEFMCIENFNGDWFEKIEFWSLKCLFLNPCYMFESLNLQCREHFILQCWEHFILQCREHFILQCWEHFILQCGEHFYFAVRGTLSIQLQVQ